jgi:hypothetical protein
MTANRVDPADLFGTEGKMDASSGEHDIKKNLRQVYEDFKRSPLAKDSPVEDMNEVELPVRAKILGMAMPLSMLIPGRIGHLLTANDGIDPMPSFY